MVDLFGQLGFFAVDTHWKQEIHYIARFPSTVDYWIVIFSFKLCIFPFTLTRGFCCRVKAGI
jgi:hypothetical protein